MNGIKEILEYLKNTIENTAIASVKALVRNIYKVRIENEVLDVNIKNLGDVTSSSKTDYTTELTQIQQALEQLPANLKGAKFPTKVEVSNLDALYKAILSMKDAIGELPKTFPDPPKFPEINIPENRMPDIRFPEFPKFPKEVSVKDLQKLIKLMEKLTAGKATDPISVRLSDGKKFYEAITEVLTSGGGAIPFTYYAGGRESALITSRREQVVSMTERYGNNNIDSPSASLTYIGQTDIDGNWLIKKIVQSGTVTSFTYATIVNNPTVTTYASAWADRTTLTYGAYSEAL